MGRRRGGAQVDELRDPGVATAVAEARGVGLARKQHMKSDGQQLEALVRKVVDRAQLGDGCPHCKSRLHDADWHEAAAE